MRRKTSLILLLLGTCLLLTLSGCGKETAGGAAQPNILLAARMGKEPCEIVAFKNYGGQETGMTFSIRIPLDKAKDLTAVPLTLELEEGISLLADSNCVLEHNGDSLVVDLTVEGPYILVGDESSGWFRLYHLLPEKAATVP